MGQGKNGRYFRYDLEIGARNDAGYDEQVDALNEFLAKYVLDRESTNT